MYQEAQARRRGTLMEGLDCCLDKQRHLDIDLYRPPLLLPPYHLTDIMLTGGLDRSQECPESNTHAPLL